MWVHVCICVCVSAPVVVVPGDMEHTPLVLRVKKEKKKFASLFYPPLGCEILEAHLKRNLLWI